MGRPRMKIKQEGLDRLQQAINKVLRGGDPLDFVNAFYCRPPEVSDFPSEYWERRICAVAEMLASSAKSLQELRG